ncbi:MAG TPA: polyprenol phosphomannose-dependent alpha 1,6 mannosyltransferase MptB [Lapillicoccus sp.]
MTMDQAVGRPVANPMVLGIAREIAGVADAWRIPAVRRGTFAGLLILVGSLTPAFLPDVNPFVDVPLLGWLQTVPGRILATAVLMAGVLLMLDSWLRLRPRVGRPQPTRHILWLWSLPLLLAPPLFSRDAYSYAGQGRIVHIGLDPYRYGPAAIAEQYSQNVDPMWLYTPAPYGPLQLQIQHLIVDVAGPNHPYAAAVAMRLPALIGVALIAFLLPWIASRFGYDMGLTTWFAVLNPLVVMHLVGGAHNDALMLGLMVLGIYLAVEKRPWLAAVAIAVAGSVKAPGLVAILIVAALEARRRKGRVPTVPEAFRELTRVGGACVAAFLAITIVCGLGLGWLGALGVPGAVRSVLSPVTVVGMGLENLLTWLQVPNTLDTTVTVDQRIGQVLGILLCARIAWRLGPVAPLRALAWVVTIIVVTGPVVHPWYLIWAGLFLGVTEGTRFWPSRVMVWVTAGLVVYSTVDSAVRNGALALGVTAALALAWLALGHDRDLDREQDPIRVATLGRWATLKTWWAILQTTATTGGPLRREEPLAVEMLHADDRPPAAVRGTRDARRSSAEAVDAATSESSLTPPS